MSRSVAENVRTFRLLTGHAPKCLIYRNYIKLVWFLIIRHMSRMSRLDVGKIKSGTGKLNKQGHGQQWAEENAGQLTEALALIKDFNIGLLSQGFEPFLILMFGFVAQNF